MRAAERAFVVEGAKAIGVALDAGMVPESVYLSPDAMSDNLIAAQVGEVHRLGSSVFTLSPGVLERVSDTVTPQPILAVMRYLDVALEDACSAGSEADAVMVVCAAVRDPGNAGTIVRSAAGAGVAGVVFCGGSVDPYNPKTVRASAGTLFQVPIVVGGPPGEVIGSLHSIGFRLIGATAHEGEDYTRCDMTGRVAIVLGNEAWGVDPEVVGLLDHRVTIPLRHGVESLNVGMAGAVLCFEVSRQQRALSSSPLSSTIAGAA